MMRTRAWGPRLLGALLTAGIVGCGAEPEIESEGIPLLTAEVALEIGEYEGAEEYVFASLEDVRLWTDGGIVLADGGVPVIRVYDAEGTHQTSFGSRGEGPAEFQNLARIYPHGPDSLIAAERMDDGLSVFSLEGELGRTLQATDVTESESFRLDSWLHGRFWTRGALTPAERARAMATLDAVGEPPRSAPGYRVAMAESDGSMWIAEPHTDASRRWTRVGPDGSANGSLDLPAEFRPTHFERDRVAGVWTGDVGVHFARVYRLVHADVDVTPPEWIGGAESPVDPEVEPPTEEELHGMIFESIRSIARAQEIYYSQHYSYTPRIGDLEELVTPDELVIDIAQGDERGWIGIFVHARSDRACALGYGFTIPPGWTPGMVACAPERAPEG